ncbi:MAG: metallophosphoesterase [Myxococcales bacterium]|nr:metallophosphoesterase [Myxococcales bacterium]
MLVAHFSDIHALSLAGTSPLAFLSKRLAGGANLLLGRRNKHPVRIFEALIDDLNRLRPDHVVCTGDMVNLSLDSEFALARALLDRLDLGPREVSLVPGNHDVYVWAARIGRAFEHALGPYATSDGASEPTFPLLRVRGPIAVIGISTALPSPAPLADGWVGKGQLAAVEEALARQGSEGRFRIVLLHHPPFKNRHAFLRGLRDRGALQKVLRRTGAELILHGHEHRDLRNTVEGPHGPIPVIGVGSGTYDDPRPERRARYNLYRIEGREITVETRVHDAASGQFR